MLKFSKIIKLLKFDSVRDGLNTSLTNKLYTNNACFLYDVMKQCSYKDLVTVVLKYIQRSFCHIAETNQQLALTFGSVKDLLSNNGLKISSEIEIFNAGKSWIKHDIHNTSQFAI